MADLGIYHYNARFYDLGLGRFLSADTMLPDAGNSQSYDRFAYVKNNPILYNDPTGHMFDCRGVFSSGSACVSGGDEDFASDSPIVTNPGRNPLNQATNDGEGLNAAFNETIQNAGSTSTQNIPDNAFVKFDPIRSDNSINKMGLQTSFSEDGRLWLTQNQYAKNITNPLELNTMLYRQDLWAENANTFNEGATLRLVNVTDATPAGVTNMENGIPQWFITHNVSSENLQIIRRLLP
jgi:RHS repeat-associated protein